VAGSAGEGSTFPAAGRGWWRAPPGKVGHAGPDGMGWSVHRFADGNVLSLVVTCCLARRRTPCRRGVAWPVDVMDVTVQDEALVLGLTREAGWRRRERESADSVAAAGSLPS